MKQKRIMIVLVSAAVLTLTGCKTNKEAFNAAYERAKAKQETVEQPAEEQVVEVVETTPTVVREASEAITIVDNKKEVTGRYGVVVGSFINRTNADSLLKTMIANGYPDAVLGRNAKDMYRVIVSFYSVKSDAQAEVGKLRSKFPDAWILVKE